ncbi:MAG: 4Fe-4S binding protein [Paludibacter sp.]|nr:4Fe-4S binding protein [Paludibacter sp.]
MKPIYNSLSVVDIQPYKTGFLQKLGLSLSALGLLILAVTLFGVEFENNGLLLTVSLLSIFVGTSIYAIKTYISLPAGIKNHGIWFNSLTSKGLLGWITAVILTGFYVVLYWFPEYLGQGVKGAANTNLIALFNPLSDLFTGKPATQWFVYGTLYTLIITTLGIKFILKYRHNRYQIIRTIVVIIAQLFLAYLIPNIMEGLNSDKAYFAMDIKYFWPLNYYFFNDWHLNNMVHGGSLGMVYLVWGIIGFLVITPFLTYYFGKRWYCSWVCGCGGLAETAGDPFRHLSDKSVRAWKIERYLIYGILLLITLITLVVLYGYFSGSSTFLGLDIYTYFTHPYGFLIGAAFSGVVGVGFYPILGSRVWCRFGCPMAAYMGIIQRFKSRFRITTNGGQCISCGNCSTYCEMGIDVRAYAQKGENIVRASCVGCGICSAVCPRGVLKLENGKLEGRIGKTFSYKK